MDKFIVAGGGLAIIIFIWWFFFGKREENSSISNTIDIVVEGGYKPSVIRVKKGVPVEIKILRKDRNSCLEEFILPEFKIKEYLPVGKKVEIKFTPLEPGEFGFHCGMNMFHGKIIVV